MKFCTDLHSTLVCWCVVSIAVCALEILHLRASFWRWIGAGRKRSFPSYIGGLCLVDLRKHTPECLVMATTIALYYSWWAFSIAPSWLIPESSKTKLRRKNLRWCRWFRYFICIYYIYLYLLKLCAILPLLKTWLVVRANPFLSSQRPTISRLGSERWTWMILDSMLSTLFLLASMLATPVIRFDHIRSHSIHRPWNFLKLIFIR